MKTTITTIIFTGLIFTLFAQIPEISYDENGNSLHLNKQEKIFEYQKTVKDNEWMSFGPYGGDVLDIALSPVDPELAFAAAGIPYYRSDNNEDWTIADNLLSLSSSGIHCFEFTADNVLLAGGNYSYGKIYRSTDEGVTWEQKIIPYNGGVLDIAVDPSNPEVIYAALSSNISATQNEVIARSEDGGEFWSLWDMTSILPVGWSCVNIVVDPTGSDTIFAIGNESFSNAKVIATFNGGTSWQDVTNNLPSGKPLNTLEINNSNIYIGGGQLFGGNVLGLYTSENYGTSWQNISAVFPNKVVNDILINPDDADNMFVATEGDGIYFTTDGGSNWTFGTAGTGDNGSARCIQFLPGDPSAVYAGFLSLGVAFSNDGGNNWMPSTVGIATLDLNDIEIDPNNPEVVLAGFEAENSGGCYLYDPDLENWKLVDGLPATRFSQVSIGIDGTMYAWSNGPTTVAQEGVYKSTDGGDTWENMGPFVGSVFETQIFAMTLSQTDPNLILIGGNNFGANGWASMIYRSTDGGASWDNVFMGPDNDSFKFLHIVPGSNDQVLYAAYKSDLQNGIIMKSIDGGDNWLPINSGIPVATKWAGSIVSDPQNPDIVYAGIGGYGGIAGTIYKSNDAGSNWDPTNISLANYCKVADILISPVNSDVIYAATSQSGVYFTEDAQNWIPANEGLPASNITGFSVPFESEEDWRFYASSFGNSSYWNSIYGSGTIGIDEAGMENIGIYPNPASGQFEVCFLKDDNQCNKIIRIFNAQGTNVKKVEVPAYSENILLNASDWISGLYFIQVECDGKIHSAKLVVH